MERNKVVLVTTNDEPIGEMDKLEAHIQGMLHRAFSVFLFNSRGEMLIHQRDILKYHGGALWTNACCSHPQWGENVRESALERLHYEMGLQCDIHPVFTFTYNTRVENNLIEHEFDHVFIGRTDALPKPNPSEVQGYRWVYPTLLEEQIVQNPEQFTSWFKMALPEVLRKIQYIFDPIA
jgi:isopentenyl-diphosphate delta-isomerase